MNKEELNTELKYFQDNIEQIGVAVYVLLKDETTPKKLDIKSDDLPNIKKMFVGSLGSEIISKEDLSVALLSTSDERRNVIYEYDIKIPEPLECLQNITSSDDHELFNLDDDRITSVIAMIIELGDEKKQVVLFKTMAQVNIYGRSSFFLKKSSERFEELKEEFFRISPNFHLLQVGNSLLVLSLDTLEKSFGFQEIIKKEAEVGVQAIEAMSLVENPETLRDLIDNVTTARKLTKVAKASPVLKSNIENKKIIQFCKYYPKLKGRIKFNTNGDKIQLDTKVSKNFFIQLLMDDFLTSELTKFHYTSLAKDEINEENDTPVGVEES